MSRVEVLMAMVEGLMSMVEGLQSRVDDRKVEVELKGYFIDFISSWNRYPGSRGFLCYVFVPEFEKPPDPEYGIGSEKTRILPIGRCKFRCYILNIVVKYRRRGHCPIHITC